MAHLRYDIGTLRPPETLADGRLRVDGYLTRSGVFDYRNSDGTIRREFRPEAEVFRPMSLATFADVIVTDDHPNEMISAENARDLAVGMLSGAPRRDGNHVAATLVINDAATIAKVKQGKVELSCGYSCDLDETPGTTPDGERYDAVQTNISGNHVAIVAVARAGRSARMRVDAMDMLSEAPTPTAKEPNVMTIEQVQADLAEANTKIGALTARADAADAALIAEQAAHAEARAAAKTAADALAAEQSARTDAAATETARVRARLKLESVAEKFLGTEVKFDGLSDREIHVAVVEKLTGESIPADEHDAFARALFVAETKRADAGDAAVDSLRTSVDSGRRDSGKSEADKARDEMLARNATAYRPSK